ncbi:MAG TPA: PQQ-binding-like beta-propeller repeat protein [Flavobacterium sp.]|nr:PQQ-binding-like beta-propeller repeat protein [Flavobacterium sp.]HRA71626.1 PQQ-binding-like beta-propeller repeat protein [Flavobacterium sp.]
MTKFLTFIVVFFYGNIWSQNEFFHSKINLPQSQLENFYSSINVDSTQVYFNANDYKVYAYDKKTGNLNWKYNSYYKSNSSPKFHQSNLLVGINEDKWVLLNAKTGDTIQTLKIEDLTTQPFFKGDIMYCAGISPAIGGAILAYDLKKNEIVWQKYIGHGVSYQPYFLKDKIVANYENQFWFELDYDGNALDKSKTCYSKNPEAPFEEHFCNIHYDVLNQFHKDFAVKNVTIEETKYHYAKNAAVILKVNKLKIINEKNKAKKEIVLDKILTLLETDVNDYTEILKVEENTVWFFYENILGVYDFKNKKTTKAYDLTQWNPHQVVLDGNTLWLIAGNDGELVGLALN